MENRKGFTLVELVIVLAILALLIAIAIPKYNQSQRKAAITAHKANVSTLETAANLYFAEKHKSGNWTGQKGEGWEEYLQHYPKVPKQLQEKNQNYTVNIKENGEIQVSPGLESLDNEGN